MTESGGAARGIVSADMTVTGPKGNQEAGVRQGVVGVDSEKRRQGFGQCSRTSRPVNFFPQWRGEVNKVPHLFCGPVIDRLSDGCQIGKRIRCGV